MSSRKPSLLIQDILDSGNKILVYTFGIDYSIVWEIKNQYLPILMHELNSLEF